MGTFIAITGLLLIAEFVGFCIGAGVMAYKLDKQNQIWAHNDLMKKLDNIEKLRLEALKQTKGDQEQ